MSQKDLKEKTKNENGGTNEEGENVGQKIKGQNNFKTLRRNW